MTAIIFAGPSLDDSDRAAWPGLQFQPPVRQGALYAAACLRPRAIGVIDGYFDGVPAVLHKEILWALSQGIAVFGASSMGALRAAELHQFGMRGIGRIFEDYRDGRLTDDDEVALLHGPPETAYPALSEPMVNIRATITRAQAEGVLDAAEASALTAAAKALFYQDRSWPEVLAAVPLPAPACERLRDWLPRGRVDRKREDARALLQAVADHLASDEPPISPGFTFELTEAWANASWLTPAPREEGPDADAILDELRLEGPAYAEVRQAALLQHLADQAATREGLKLQPKELAKAAEDLRLPLGLLRKRDLDEWAHKNGLDDAGLARLIRARASVENLARRLDGALRPAMLDQLRLQNRYSTLRDNALASPDQGTPRTPPRPLLLAWYFETRLGREIPADLNEYAAGLGLSDLDRFFELLGKDFARHHSR
ncbi:TfuA-like protein [Paracoccus sp. J56]|uniref:TfuA-like protein n=1 Tax=Paracoccus sp. J56 TaxID=935850 RepID=UPI000A0B8EA0|nr:TfuA-like protein [Paracoccus sp. J56]SMG40918.1 hypothetical protein SAMN02746000_02441 [Paracoccus sp. J56]